MSRAHSNGNPDRVYTRLCAHTLAYVDGARVIKPGDAVLYRFGKTTFAATVIQTGKCRVLIEHIDSIGDKHVRRVRWCVPDSLIWRGAAFQ